MIIDFFLGAWQRMSFLCLRHVLLTPVSLAVGMHFTFLRDGDQSDLLCNFTVLHTW